MGVIHFIGIQLLCFHNVMTSFEQEDAMQARIRLGARTHTHTGAVLQRLGNETVRECLLTYFSPRLRNLQLRELREQRVHISIIHVFFDRPRGWNKVGVATIN